MSAIATVLHGRGEHVTGSDQERSSFARRLEAAGLAIEYEHAAPNVEGVDLVLASAAIPEDNVELAAARDAGIPVLRRHQFWGDLTRGARTLAVAGTHGKTTTAGLLAWILEQVGRQPSFIVGGELMNFGANAQHGAGPDFVVEADEYQLAFLGINPETAVITNLEHDHPDQFASEQEVRQAFQAFVDQVQARVIVNADSENASALEMGTKERVTFGLTAEADWRAEEMRPNGAGGSDFLVLRAGDVQGLARTRLPGRHNVSNVLAALAAVESVGVDFAEALEPLTGFLGVSRRFQALADSEVLTVIDDYAHHPTEIEATLAAARQRYPGRRIIAVFQPHTYSRTRQFLPQLATAFEAAERVIVTDIYPAREPADPTMDARRVVEALDHPEAEYIGPLSEAAGALLADLQEGDVVITLSAGDGNRVGRLLLEGTTKEKRGKKHGQEG